MDAVGSDARDDMEFVRVGSVDGLGFGGGVVFDSAGGGGVVLGSDGGGEVCSDCFFLVCFLFRLLDTSSLRPFLFVNPIVGESFCLYGFSLQIE